MSFHVGYLITVHFLAFIGLSLIVCIAVQVRRSYRKPALERTDDSDTELANTTVYSPPSYGLRVVK